MRSGTMGLSIDRRLSPVARAAARQLMPLVLVALLFCGGAMAVYLVYRAPSEERLMRAISAHQTIRQTQAQRQAAKKTVEDMTEVWKGLPERRDFPRIILSITELARGNRVSMPGMNFTFEKVEGGGAAKAAITFRADGAYTDVRHFIHHLESTGPHLFIESLDAARLAGQHESHRVSFNVKVVTFLREEQTGTAGGV